MSKMGFRQQGRSQIYSDGYTTVELKGNSLDVTTRYGREFDVAELEKKYLSEVVQDTAQQYGWKLESVGEDEWDIIKEY